MKERNLNESFGTISETINAITLWKINPMMQHHNVRMVNAF